MLLSREATERPIVAVDGDVRFRRRHRLVLLLLILHVPAVAGLAFDAGRPVVDLLAGGAVVVLGVVVVGRLPVTARLCAVALAAGLAWAVLMVALVLGAGIPVFLHAGVVGLLAIGHLVASWRVEGDPAPGVAADAEEPGATPERAADLGPAAEAGAAEGAEAAPAAEASDGTATVAVRDVYTGVWTAHRPAPARTRVVRVAEPAPADAGDARTTGGDAAAVPDPAAAPDAADEEQGETAAAQDEALATLESLEEWVDRHGEDGSEAGVAPTPEPHEVRATPPEADVSRPDRDGAATEPRPAVEAQDPDLTREVLAGLHAGALGEGTGSGAA